MPARQPTLGERLKSPQNRTLGIHLKVSVAGLFLKSDTIAVQDQNRRIWKLPTGRLHFFSFRYGAFLMPQRPKFSLRTFSTRQASNNSVRAGSWLPIFNAPFRICRISPVASSPLHKLQPRLESDENTFACSRPVRIRRRVAPPPMMQHEEHFSEFSRREVKNKHGFVPSRHFRAWHAHAGCSAVSLHSTQHLFACGAKVKAMQHLFRFKPNPIGKFRERTMPCFAKNSAPHTQNRCRHGPLLTEPILWVRLFEHS